ncbi:MAG: hypothetical protein ACTHLD_19355 [Chitinophaga sp.]
MNAGFCRITKAKTCIFMSMKQILTYQLAFIITLAIIKPVAGFARETGKEKERFPAGIHINLPVTDTVPSPAKPGETKKEEKKIPDIKKVPKSRRQVKPLPIPVPVRIKPIKIIKPKVLKPKVGLKL